MARTGRPAGGRRHLRPRLRLRLAADEVRPARSASAPATQTYALYGQEAIGSTWALAKMNMFLHGEDNHRIEWGDTLRNPKLLEATTACSSISTWWSPTRPSRSRSGASRSAAADKYKPLPARRAAAHQGRLRLHPAHDRDHEARHRPHGAWWCRTACCSAARPKAGSASSSIEENLLDAVIGLPEKLFYGTGIPAAVLVFRKKKHDDKVLFIDASREYQDGKNQNLLRREDLEKIAATCSGEAERGQVRLPRDARARSPRTTTTSTSRATSTPSRKRRRST